MVAIKMCLFCSTMHTTATITGANCAIPEYYKVAAVFTMAAILFILIILSYFWDVIKKKNKRKVE